MADIHRILVAAKHSDDVYAELISVGSTDGSVTIVSARLTGECDNQGTPLYDVEYVGQKVTPQA